MRILFHSPHFKATNLCTAPVYQAVSLKALWAPVNIFLFTIYLLCGAKCSWKSSQGSTTCVYLKSYHVLDCWPSVKSNIESRKALCFLHLLSFEHVVPAGVNVLFSNEMRIGSYLQSWLFTAFWDKIETLGFLIVRNTVFGKFEFLFEKILTSCV